MITPEDLLGMAAVRDVRQFRKGAKVTSPEMLKLTDAMNYKLPRDYPQWKVISGVLASQLWLIQDMELMKDVDTSSQIAINQLSQWFLEDAPLYCISRELFEEFKASDLSNFSGLFVDFEPAVRTFMVVFPKGCFVTGEGYEMQLMAAHWSKLSDLALPPLKNHGIRIPRLDFDGATNHSTVAIDSGATSWSSGIGFDEDGTPKYSDKSDLGMLTFDEFDFDDADILKRVSLQCMLAMTFAPELLEDAATKASSHWLW